MPWSSADTLARVLRALGVPLAVQAVPDPVIGTGEVIVDFMAASVLPYTREVFSGGRQYPIVLPMIQGIGADGRVRAVGPDSTRLSIGEWVFCDPMVRSRDDALTPDIALQGWSARGDGGLRLQCYYHDGPFVEQVRIPTENAVPIGPIDPAQAAAWCSLGTLLVPYGGLLAGHFQAGETLLISGATGNFGSACVAVALAIGAGCVVAPGRNEAMLAELGRRYGSRVRTVKLEGNPIEDTARMRDAANGSIDMVLDLLPPSAGAAVTRAAAMTVRESGRIILMGGVGMLGGKDLALPYPWIMRNNITLRGQWMYSRDAPTRIVGLVRSGLLSLNDNNVKTFALADVNAAVKHAAANGGAFRQTVLTM